MKFPVKMITLLMVIAFILPGLACTRSMNLAKETLTEFPAYDMEDAQAVEDVLQNAQAQTRQFAFTITEEQLTSYLTLKLSETQDDFITQNTVVSLDNNLIIIEADVFLSNIGIKVPAQISLSGRTTIDGNLEFLLENVSLGNIDIPESLERNLSTAMEEAMNSNIGTTLSGFRIETLFIDEGMITIAGSKR